MNVLGIREKLQVIEAEQSRQNSLQRGKEKIERWKRLNIDTTSKRRVYLERKAAEIETKKRAVEERGARIVEEKAAEIETEKRAVEERGARIVEEIEQDVVRLTKRRITFIR
jgi:hypothetical protein